MTGAGPLRGTVPFERPGAALKGVRLTGDRRP